MNVNNLNPTKTGLLFFDMLNVYFQGIPEEKQKALKPVVDNAVRLMNGARQAGMLIYYAMANHRPDGESRYTAITDTDMRLRPWPNDDCNPTVHGATEGSREQKVIDEIAPNLRIILFRNIAGTPFTRPTSILPCARAASIPSSSPAWPSTSAVHP